MRAFWIQSKSRACGGGARPFGRITAAAEGALSFRCGSMPLLHHDDQSRFSSVASHSASARSRRSPFCGSHAGHVAPFNPGSIVPRHGLLHLVSNLQQLSLIPHSSSKLEPYG
jgi:hypothetical protein